MTWDNLTDAQIRQLGQWLVYAEHHAAFRFAHADDRAAMCGWSFEISNAADTLVQLRAIWEKRHGRPPIPPVPMEPSHLPSYGG
jgi:hypothetical protein